jgi:ABC-2 type transport system ATP-binding protein
VRVDGIDVVERPDAVRERIGYLPDTPPLYGEMRVEEFLGYAARLRGVASGDVPKRVQDAVAMTRLSEVADDPISSLSHGYRQRVGIAQAVIHQPRLVVLDEPISGLDPVQIVDMRQTVRDLGGKHTVLVSSHILNEISETCDRLLVIKNGEIVAQGTESELSKKLLQGVRVRVTVRAADGDARDKAERTLRGVAGVRAIESADPPEPGDDLASFSVDANDDVRAAVAAAVVNAGLSMVERARYARELESVFLRLAAPATGSAAARSEVQA